MIQNDVETITGSTDDLFEIYKTEVDGGKIGSVWDDYYETEFFNTATDSEDATITRTGVAGDPVMDLQYLLVKDGVEHQPIWYLYDIGG